MRLDHVGARVRRPARGLRVVACELLAVTAWRGGADHAHREELAPGEARARPGHIRAPHLRLGRGQAERHRPGHACRVEAPRCRLGHRRIAEAAEDQIGRGKGRALHGPHRLVGQEAVAEPRIGLDPLRIGQGTGRDAHRAVHHAIEEARGRRRHLARAGRQLGRVGRVPGERAVQSIRDQDFDSRESKVHASSGVMDDRSGSEGPPYPGRLSEPTRTKPLSMRRRAPLSSPR